MKLASFLLFTVYTALASGLSTDPDDIAFYLYSNASTSVDTDILDYNDIQTILDSRYDSAKPLIMYTGGFTQNCTAGLPVINAYLAQDFLDNFNIICVEWGPLAGKLDSIAPLYAYNLSVPMTGANWITVGQYPLYQSVVQNVPAVAERIRDFLLLLDTNSLLPVDSYANSHLIGCDVGAHVMGVVGKLFQDVSIVIGRITGLDPAAPGFYGVAETMRLYETDAAYVDLLCTNPGGAGYCDDDVAVARTFINGNSPLFIQPACSGYNAFNPFCSHLLSINFFAKSITQTALTVTSCNINDPMWTTNCGSPLDAIPFGEYMPTSALGNFYVNNLSPY